MSWQIETVGESPAVKRGLSSPQLIEQLGFAGPAATPARSDADPAKHAAAATAAGDSGASGVWNFLGNQVGAAAKGMVDFGKAIIANPTGAEAGLALMGGVAVVDGVLSWRNRLGNAVAREATTFVPGMQTTRMFKSEGLAREYSVYVPKTLAPGENSAVLMAMDGLTVRNQAGSMGGINGINALAEKHGFIAVYPMPRTQLLGQVSSWNPGLLNARAGYSDSRYLTGVLDDLSASGLKIDQSRIYGTAFSEGTIPLNQAARESGRFAGLAINSGTMLKSDIPAAGVKNTVIIHGAMDPTLPLSGGAGPNTQILVRLGHRRILESQPSMQAVRYAEANGFKGAPQVTEHAGFTERVFPAAQTTTGAEVREYVIKAPFGGHTWHGRGGGAGTESAVSGRNGPMTPPEVFDTNAKIAEIFRLGKPIARDLR